jgi:hypothetical protein
MLTSSLFQNEKKLACQMRDAHADRVTGLKCMPQEPILVTSSPDNTIKQVKAHLHSPTHISDFVLYGMNLPYNKNRIDPIFVCRAAQHLAKCWTV